MEFALVINSDNDAFADGNDSNEVARILTATAKSIMENGIHDRTIYDINGNAVGTVTLSIKMRVTKEYLEEQGYYAIRQLPDGTWAGLVQLAFTTGLCLNLDETGYDSRFCYEDQQDAVYALMALKSAKDTPMVGWVAQR